MSADRGQPESDDPGLEVWRRGEGGRRLVDRAELVDRMGMTEQTLSRLYSQRASTGHPAAIGRVGRRLLWDLDEVSAWVDARLEAKRAGMTPLDRAGDPDEFVDVDEAARVLGYANRRTIDSYLARRGRGYFPEPDDPAGRRWRRRTLWAFAERRSRPGRAGHSTSG